MKISELAVKNPQFTLIIFAMLAALGVASFQSIPRSEDPQFPIPGFTVIAVNPGATPVDMEEQVANPIEEKLAELDDIKKLQTKITDGLTITIIEFEADTDADTKETEVRRQVAAVKDDLPAELLDLQVKRYSTTNVSLVQIALVSPTASWTELRRTAERLERRLEGVKGIREASTWAWPEREARVALDVEKLAELGLPLDQVLGAIRSDNTSIPGGTVDAGSRRLSIKSSGPLRDAAELGQVVVGGDGQHVVHLADVADVDWAVEAARHLGRYDGQRAVFVTATQKDGQNVFDVQKGIKAEVAAFEKELPAGITLERGFDQADNVDARLGSLYKDFVIAILLVLITLLPLGLRASMIVMVSIPLSLAIGLSLLHLFGFNINQLSIVGFVIALGLLVDDSIVVVENITRFLREGRSRTEAAIMATRQIAVAVLGCTATLIFAFLPLLFLPGGPGNFIRSLPMAVVLTIVASLFVSLTIIPFLASQTLAKDGGGHENAALRLLTRGINASYRPILKVVLARPKTTLLAAGALFAASLLLVPRVGFSLFPKAGTRQFLVTIEMPEGTSLSRTDEETRFVEGVLAARPEVEWVMSNVGHGNPQVYYNVPPTPENASVAELFVQLDRFDPRSTPRLYDELRAEFAARPGARIQVKEFENGPPIDAPIAMRLLGDDLVALGEAAAQVERIMKDTPGTRDVHNPSKQRRTDLVAAVDRDRAGLAGVPSANVALALRLGVAGLGAGTLRAPDGDESDIAITLAGVGRSRLDALPHLRVASVTGQAVPMAQLADVELTSSPTSIQHWGSQQRAVTVSAHVETGENVDRLTKQILAKLDATTLPAGVRLVPAGEIESRAESFGGLGTAIIVAIFMVLAILVLEFKTFRGTLVVASVIPLGILGGIVALYVAGYTLSFTAIVGFIALIGIEIKNSILLVDFTNQLRAEGKPLREAIQEAGEIRFLPIVLTTATAIGGLVPLAIQGSALYSPLAVVIIGGLISSTVLSRLVTPVAYQLLAPKAA